MWKEVLAKIFNSNRGKIIGTIIGLLTAIFILVIGFFKTIFIVIFMFLGYYIGKRIDKNESFLDLIEKILPDEWK